MQGETSLKARIGAAARGMLPWATLVVAVALLSAVVPVGEALWSKVLVIAGEVHTREFEPPPEDHEGEGCSPGFWKQSHHFDDWPGIFSTDDRVSDFLGPDAPSDLTMLEALEQGGGGMNALLRHAVAALLNSAHPDIDYAYDIDEIIALFQGVVDGGDVEAVKELLEEANQAGCPLPDDDNDEGGDDNGDGEDDDVDCEESIGGEELEDLDASSTSGEESHETGEGNDCEDEESLDARGQEIGSPDTTPTPEPLILGSETPTEVVEEPSEEPEEGSSADPSESETPEPPATPTP